MDENTTSPDQFWSLILHESQGYNVPILGSLLSQYTGIPPADANGKVRYCRGVLLKGVSMELAEKMGDELEKLNQPFSLEPMENHCFEPPIHTVGKARIEENGLKFFLSGYVEKVLDWDKIASVNFVTLNLESEEKEKKKQSFSIPNIQYFFSLDLASQEELNREEIPEPLKTGLLDHHFILSENAKVVVQKKDYLWKIQDGEKELVAKVDGEKIKIFLLQGKQLSPKAQAVMEDIFFLHLKYYKPQLFFDLLYLEGPTIYRFYRDRMNFSLMDNPKPHSLDNFLTFFEELIPHLSQAYQTESTTLFLKKINRPPEEDQQKEKIKNLFDRARVLDDTLFYKEEELRNYNEWLGHKVGLSQKALVVEKDSSDKRWDIPLTEPKTSFFDGMRGPFILGFLGAIWIPMFLYGWAQFRHMEHATGLSLNLQEVQNLVLMATGVALVCFVLLRLLLRISYHYVGAILLIAGTLAFSYPIVLVLSNEARMQGNVQGRKIWDDLQKYYRVKRDKSKDGKGDFPATLLKLYKRVPLDPWEHRWYYKKKSRESFELRSPGPDGKLGTRDDLRDPFK